MARRTASDTLQPRYELLKDGTFVIDNYNQAQPFSSFFPGIAGLKGIPMWVFYVNRNQGISSFGIKNKDYAISEFYPANSAYGLTATQGFRTLIKVRRQNKSFFYEPFKINDGICGSWEVSQRMMVRPHETLFEDINRTLGLKTTVRYFTLPQEPIAALVRIVTFENVGKGALEIEAVDGLPRIIPYWMNDWILKHMSYTAQAWATVTNFDKTGVPFYKLKVEINDRPEVTVLEKGNFYASFVEQGRSFRKAGIIIDPGVVFGRDLSFTAPSRFLADDFKVPAGQFGDNKYPAAMSHVVSRLAPGATASVYSMTGHINSEAELNEFVGRAGSKAYFNRKADENRAIIADVTAPIQTESAIPAFDLYCKQTYLDNLLRGGTPIMLPAGDGEIVYYVYSRKHGDIERDYNYFQLSPSYYSQGNGNFRDMNQNKRSDIFFKPGIGDCNVVSFYNMSQLDGYNPLLVKGSLFCVDIKKNASLPAKLADKKYSRQLTEFFAKPFEPGDLLLFIRNSGIKLKVSDDELFRLVLGCADCLQEAEHGEGFWTDHWTYNIDLLESYAAVYPEREKALLFDKKEFTFYDNNHVVLPRRDKYVNADGKIRQFGSVVVDPEKAKMLRDRSQNVHVVREKKGTGDLYRTTLAVKMLCLVLNKFATLDSEGMGIEMEADKPSWYDALNGLPGVFGSSIPETFELKRMIRYLIDRGNAFDIGGNYRLNVPEEMARFLAGLSALLDKRLNAFEFWDKATSLKEVYRDDIRMGVTGKETAIEWSVLTAFFEKVLKKIDAGLSRAKDPATGLYYTYMSYEAAQFRATTRLSHQGWPCVDIRSFRRKPLPLFLEGPVHYLKTETDREKIVRMHQAMQRSPLYDRKLGMYKVNASLESEPKDLGRCTVFAPGWLENSSIWLHMEYKYLLELLKAGLVDEFFAEFKKAGVCFQQPEIYGRSILENSSFIASSAFPDKNAWGRGFVARLSGSTAEFIEMWLNITLGRKPFTVRDGSVALELKPAIPGDFFTREGIFSCTLLGTTVLRYHNRKRTDTYAAGASLKRIDIRWKNGGTETVEGGLVTGAAAEKIRNGEADRVDAHF